MLDNKVILITGGTGSFGKKFIETALTRFKPKKVICYSRDELKQFELQQVWPPEGRAPIRYFIGDVRDLPRMKRAMEGVDIVIHAAAFKQVPAAEYNPFEAVKTNILGSQNVIDAAMDSGVKTVIALSTDKAVAPINLYGATKLAADKLFIAANNYSGSKNIKFSVVRYGNVMGSRGSVIPFFLKHREKGFLPVTDRRMTRFNITLEAAVDFVIQNIRRMHGREIFVPKIPSYRIVDVAEAIAPGCRIEEVGSRQGDKLHEDLITANEAVSTLEFKSHFVILPSDFYSTKYKSNSSDGDGGNGRRGQPCQPGFTYNSGSNTHFLTVDEISHLVEHHLGIQQHDEHIIEVADH
ncbi:MAG: UDP-N-acetylglucosamine 4,6-dehydratase (inverting) [bacterium]